MPLTANQVKNEKPTAKQKFISDEKGLRLLVTPDGGKYWRFKYRFANKQKTLALGVYPEVSLKRARELRDDARQKVRQGIDPAQERRLERQNLINANDNQVRSVAEDWWNQKKSDWQEGHAAKVWRRLDDNFLKQYGTMPITDLTTQDVIKAVRAKEDKSHLDVAHRLLQDISRVCRFAFQTNVIKDNPARDLGDILKPNRAKHRDSMPPKFLPTFLNELERYGQGERSYTRCALKLLVLTFVRPGELRGARWEEFDFDNKVWVIPPERMKMSREHRVPLSTQSLAVLDEIKLMSGELELLFPGERSSKQPMSDNTMRRALFRLGYDGKTAGKPKALPHGFRTTASSILNENKFRADVVEKQLSHEYKNQVRGAYMDHAEFWDERVEMMQWWGSFLYGETR